MPGTQNQFATISAASVDLLALLQQLIAIGNEPAGIALGQIDFGWEVCSTGGSPRTFTVSDYSIEMAAK